MPDEAGPQMLTGAVTQILNVNPLVMAVDDFLTPGECEQLIGLAGGRLKRASIHDKHYRATYSEARTNSDCMLLPGQFPQVAPVCLKLGILLRLPFQNAEGVVVLHYSPGQQFKAHPDGITIDTDPETLAKIDEAGGQRLFTTICYLNDVEAGGATSFPNLGISVAPKKGRLLIFANTLAGTRAPTALALHAGEPVEKGEKWAATVWWRETAYNPTNAPVPN